MRIYSIGIVVLGKWYERVLNEDNKTETNKIINILVCDSNRFKAEIYKNLLYLVAEKHNYMISVEIYTSELELIFTVEDERICSWDILIVNTSLKKNKGIDVVNSLKTRGCMGEVIFLGSGSEEAYESYQVSPFYYMLQDKTTLEGFEDVILKCLKLIQKRKRNQLMLDTDNGKIKADIDSIVFMKIMHRIIDVYSASGRIGQFYSSFQNVESLLKERGFVRTHKAYLVNVKYVEALSNSELTTTTNDIIPVSRTYRKDLIDYMVKLGDVVIM